MHQALHHRRDLGGGAAPELAVDAEAAPPNMATIFCLFRVPVGCRGTSATGSREELLALLSHFEVARIAIRSLSVEREGLFLLFRRC